MCFDSEMKHLQATGLGSKVNNKADVISEETLWQKKFLGDHSPQSLVDTVLYMNGLYFAIRSGSDHRQLRHHPCQIEVVEKPGERSYLQYTEDISQGNGE